MSLRLCIIIGTFIGLSSSNVLTLQSRDDYTAIQHCIYSDEPDLFSKQGLSENPNCLLETISAKHVSQTSQQKLKQDIQHV